MNSHINTLKKVLKYISIAYLIYLTVAIIWYIMPIPVILKVAQFSYPEIAKQLEIPSMDNFPKFTSTQRAISDDELLFLGGILENQKMITELDKKIRNAGYEKIKS
jgi:hypothetical protein